MYRPPNTCKSRFLEEFESYLDDMTQSQTGVLICGDFNFWIDDALDLRGGEFLEMMKSHHFKNNVNCGTARSGHMLDLVFDNGVLGDILNLEVEPDFSVSPSHKFIKFDIRVSGMEKKRKFIKFRNKNSLVPLSFALSAT